MALCTDAMALAPSPVAAATRFIEPEWTSPTANTAGMLVSNGSGRRPSAVQAGPRSPSVSWTSVRMKPSSPVAIPASQLVAGSAPMKQNKPEHGWACTVSAAARERPTDAARLLAAADATRRPLQYLAPGYTANRGAATSAAGQARHALGGDRFTQAWEQGQQLTLDEAVAYAARKGGGRKRPATGWASLTPAELQVVRLVGEGLRNDAIAARLFLAPGTVKVHLSHIFAKLAITTRAELAAQAATHDLTPR